MENNKSDSTLSVIHSVHFSYRDLLTIMLPTIALVGWAISVHFANIREHAFQREWNGKIEERITKLEETVVGMKEQHMQIMGKLEVIQSNQVIVLETLNGLKTGQRNLRAAFENDGTSIKR